jgi:hypothetical protein
MRVTCILQSSSILTIACLAAAIGSAQQHHVYSFFGEELDLLGGAVAGAGDLDGDGFAECLVGAPYGASSNLRTGVAHVYSGVDGRVVRRHAGERGFDGFGAAVAMIGDIDADGVGDYAIGAPSAPYVNPAGPGKAWVFSGKSGRELRTHMGVSSRRIGRKIAITGIRDSDSDGRPDYVIAFGGEYDCELLVVSGATGTTLRQISQPAHFEFAASIATIGDVDADGGDEVAVGAPGQNNVFVFSTKTGAMLQRLTYTNSARLGAGVAALGDVTKDGVPDLAVGASEYRQGNQTPGAVFIVSGKDGSIARMLVGQSESGRFGENLAALGDIDGDKIGDLGVHAQQEGTGSRGQGAVLVFSVDGSTPKRMFLGDANGDNFGQALAAAGDVNGDGLPDLLVGAPGNSAVGRFSGLARVLSYEPLGLSSRTRTVSIFHAGYQLLDLDVGRTHANSFYFVLGSASGTRPGIRLGSVVLPLNLDAYLGLTAAAPQAVIFNNLAFTDGEGRSRLAFRLPSGLPPALAGLLLWHACLVVGPAGPLASNAVPVRLELF